MNRLLIVLIATVLLVYGVAQTLLSYQLIRQTRDFYQPEQIRKLADIAMEYLRLEKNGVGGEIVSTPERIQEDARFISEQKAFLAAEAQFGSRLFQRWSLISSALTLVVLAVVLGAAVLLARRSLQPAVALRAALEQHIAGEPANLPPARYKKVAQLNAEFLKLLDLQRAKTLQDRAELQIEQWQTTARILIHEIKNKLSPVNLDVEFLSSRLEHEDSGAADDRLRNSIGRIHQNIAHIGTLLASFRELAGLPPPKLEWISIAQLVHRAVAGADGFSGLELSLKLSDEGNEVDLVFVDSFYLQLVLVNLIKNSKEAGADKIEITWNQSEKVLELTDDGPGLPDFLIVALNSDSLKPGYTSKSTGTGMGLYIVAELCRVLGIVLHAANENGNCYIRLEFNHG